MQALDVRAGDLSIQFDQYLTGLYGLSVVDMNGLDHRYFAGLDDLALAAGDDLAGGGGDHVDFADAGPQQRQGGEGHDRPLDDPGSRVHGRFLQGQGGGQKVHFVIQPWRRIHGLAVAPGVTPGLAVSVDQLTLGTHAAPPCCKRCKRE